MNDKKCKAVVTTCGDAKKILQQDGTCADACPDYEAIDESGGLTFKKCKAGATCTGSDVLKRDGTCAATCPTYDFKNDSTKKCDAVSCSNEKTNVALKRDGVCAATCPDYDENVNNKCTEKKVAECTG